MSISPFWSGAGLALLLLASACSRPVAVCQPGQAPRTVPAVRDATVGYHLFTHAHNDYAHDYPLVEALRAHIYSVEADIWYAEGSLEVAHLGFTPRGTLEALYLEPLQARVRAYGSVYGDGLPFRLVVDLKESTPALIQTLARTIARYPMLTVETPEGSQRGPVSIVLTGDEPLKRDYVQRYLPRFANRDSNDFHLDDPPSDGRWTDYALDWSTVLSWDGSGAMPPDQERRLGCLVENAHALGRKLRIFNGPDREEVWRAELTHGVDFINSDRLPELSAFLDAQP